MSKNLKKILKKIEKIQILKLSEINFKTNLNVDDIIKIADTYIKEQEEPYEINKNNILYDPESHVTNEPVWYVDVLPIKVKEIWPKETWPEAYDTLAISDREGRLVYVQNDHGVIIKKY